jgi:hypothetical protein
MRSNKFLVGTTWEDGYKSKLTVKFNDHDVLVVKVEMLNGTVRDRILNKDGTTDKDTRQSIKQGWRG